MSGIPTAISRRVGVLAFDAEAVVLVLETSCTVGECNSPLLQAPDEFGRNPGITELLCRLPYLPATDIPVRASCRVSVSGQAKRQVLRDRVLQGKRQSKHRVDRRGMLLITDAERPRPLG